MKLQKLNCPNCDALLNMELTKESDYIFCPYCGQQFHIDNEKREYTVNKNINKNVNINKTIEHIKRNIDESEEARSSAKETKYMVLLIAFMFIILSGMVVMDKIGDWKAEQAIHEAEQQGKIKIGSSRDFKGQNYEAVVAQLQALGFENIETIDLDDAGLFTKDGSVASVSVNGDSDFTEENYFFTIDKITENEKYTL